VIRRSTKYKKGVFQRCGDECPPDLCRKHSWSYTVELVGKGGSRRHISKGGFPGAKAASEARDRMVQKYRDKKLPRTTRSRSRRGWASGSPAGKSEAS
jgi:hypothetical protein